MASKPTSKFMSMIDNFDVLDEIKGQLAVKACEGIGTVSGKHVRVMYTSLNPTFILQNWGMQGYTFFLIFAPKHRLWVLVRTASLSKK